MKISKKIKLLFKVYFPTYKFVPPSIYEPSYGLQARIDNFSGLCVSWSILYLHYRILNPIINIKTLVKHIDRYMTKKKILQYTRYIEDTLKHK